MSIKIITIFFIKKVLQLFKQSITHIFQEDSFNELSIRTKFMSLINTYNDRHQLHINNTTYYLDRYSQFIKHILQSKYWKHTKWLAIPLQIGD